MKNRMILKRWNLLRFLPALLALVLISGCTKESSRKDEEMDTGYAMIDADIRTYAASASSDPNSRGIAEYAIRRVRLYAFDGDKLDNMVYVEAPVSGNTGEINVHMKVKQTPGKTLYVIVNEPTDAAMQSRLTMINNPAAFAEVEYAMADYFTDAQKAFNSDAAFGADDFCLPMSGKLANVNTVSSGADIPVTLSVTRSLARVDVLVQKYPSITAAITFKSTTKLDIVGTRTKGFLFGERLASGLSGDLNTVTDAVAGTADVQTVPVGNIGNNKAAVRVFSFYTPERDCTTNKLGFNLKGVGFGRETRDYQIEIGNQEDAMLEKIERNKVYRIYCTFKSQNTTVETTILDWDDVALTGDIAPGSMFIVGRSRVIMDYAAQNNSFSTHVDFLSDGDMVFFVGYVIKDAAGKELSLTTDGTNLPVWLPKDKITGLPNGTGVRGTISLTYVPAIYNLADVNALRPDVVLRLKSGNIIHDITVVYDNGVIPESELGVDWTINRPAVGLQVAKRGGNILPSGVALARDLSSLWGTNAGALIDAEQPGFGYGASNTTSAVTTQGKTAVVAYICRSMGVDWYLPSVKELQKISDTRKFLGPSYSFSITSDYLWSSTTDGSSSTWRVSMLNGTADSSFRANKMGVRCARNV